MRKRDEINGWTIEMADCEATMLREIAEPLCKRIDIAKSYALALRSSERGSIDWKKVNAAIIERWSIAALKWIKAKAWSGKCFGYEAIVED